MRIAIIGAGFTGLSAAYRLTKNGHQVTIYEKDSLPGGLAIGYQEKEWAWSLEKHYHHWFSNDKYVLNLAKEIKYKVLIPRPRTAVYIGKDIFQLDSPISLLKLPMLTIIDKIRMAAVLAFLRFNPFWMPLEKIYADGFLKTTMGIKGYNLLWQPQFENKFGRFAKEISLAWFWARIKKRTPSLAYPEGGFLKFAQHLVKVIQDQGGIFKFNSEILNVKDGKHVIITSSLKDNTENITFDKTIVTLPSFLFLQIAPQLPASYKNKMTRLKGLGATNLVLRLKKPFLKDNTYWLSVCDTTSPVMAIVEHTNFMSNKNYNNEHIIYLGNYVPMDHEYFSMNEKQMLNKFDPFLKKINPRYKENLISMKLFKAPFAQPIIPVNYSKLIPPMRTPLPNVLLANIEQVYPWDRGTNYAVELGEIAAKTITGN